jgi:hypothetical protein
MGEQNASHKEASTPFFPHPLEAKVTHMDGKPLRKPPSHFDIEPFSKRAV